MERRREGVTLAHDDAGEGDPPLILVHGWGADRRVMRPLFDDQRRSRRAVSVDLRGFGESAAPDHPRTIRGHADDIAALCTELGPERFVIAGHSMGGVVALDLAARHGDRVAAAVVLEALVVPPPETVAGLRTVLDGLRGDGYRDVAAGLIRHVAGPHLAPEDRERLAATAAACSPGLLAASLEDMLAFDSAAAAACVRCPLLYVGSAFYSDLPRLRALCSGVVIGQVVGCGHYFPLEVPEQLNPMVARFLRTCVRALS